jgi:hypothetical protein
MTTTLTSNGTQRRTLSSQLDRLDGILDALSDGLNQAVASAVQNTVEQAVREAVQLAVQQAVQGLVSEVLTNPDALALLRAALAPDPTMHVPPPPPPAPRHPTGMGAWLWDRARQACAALGRGASQAKSAVKVGLRIASPYRKPLMIAAGVGTAVAVGACMADPWIAGPASWLAGFIGTLAVRARVALRRGLGLEPALA